MSWRALTLSMIADLLMNSADLADEEMFFNVTAPDLNAMDSIDISILTDSLMAV
jgi:hypothetical protein